MVTNWFDNPTKIDWQHHFVRYALWCYNPHFILLYVDKAYMLVWWIGGPEKVIKIRLEWHILQLESTDDKETTK